MIVRINERLNNNNHRLAYTLTAYLMYTCYSLLLGLFVSIFDKNVYPLFEAFFIGSFFGIIVSILVYFKHPIHLDWGPPFTRL